MPFLLLALDDLMTGSRLEVAATHLGYETRYARSAQEFRAGVAAGPALVLLATHQTRLPWESLLAEMREQPDRPPVLAFGSHVDAETRQRARRAGATRWVANSRIAADLPGLLRDLAREPGRGDDTRSA